MMYTETDLRLDYVLLLRIRLDDLLGSQGDNLLEPNDKNVWAK